MRFALVLLVAVACSSGDPPPDGDVVDELFVNDGEIATVTCDCFEAEYGSYDECLVAEGYVDSRPCIRAAYEASEGTLQTTVECLIGYTQAFQECIRGIGCDVDAWAACYEEGNELFDPCMVNPEAQAEADALFDCYPGDF